MTTKAVWPVEPKYLLSVPLQKEFVHLHSRISRDQHYLLAQGAYLTPTLPASIAVLQVPEYRTFHAIPFSKEYIIPDIQNGLSRQRFANAESCVFMGSAL